MTIRHELIDHSPSYYYKWDSEGNDWQTGTPFGKEHAYNMNFDEYTIGTYRFRVRTSDPWTTQPGTSMVPGIPTISAPYPENKATARAWSKMTQSEFNAGVFAGEFRETVRFISDSVGRLASVARLLRAGRFGDAARKVYRGQPGSLPKNVANEWLAYNYALMPLLRDIANAYDYLKREFVVVKRLSTGASEDHSRQLVTQSSGKWRCVWSLKASKACGFRMLTGYRISEIDRLGLTDPASIAWELTRLSFVVDWLIPVGSFLAAVNARRNLTPLGDGIWGSYVHKESLTLMAADSLDPSRYDLSGLLGTNRQFARTLRVPKTSLPVKLPSIENPLGFEYGRYLTAVALLGQAVRGR